jgi:hypothetical protein
MDMKIISGVHRSDEVHLPLEVLSLIAAYVARGDESQKTLWACSLASRAWYAVAISHLYHRPRLTARNFDHFARTVCLPVASRKKKVGVEQFLAHLDMRNIAYESSNSLTSRLISRSKTSLESFYSPAVTFT